MEVKVPSTYDPESNVIFCFPEDNQGKGWEAITRGLDNILELRKLLRANKSDLEALG